MWSTVTIGGCSFVPPLSFELNIKENIKDIVNCSKGPIDIAIELCLYCMKTQIFMEGNQRVSIIFENHYLISQGGGFIL